MQVYGDNVPLQGRWLEEAHSKVPIEVQHLLLCLGGVGSESCLQKQHNINPMAHIYVNLYH